MKALLTFLLVLSSCGRAGPTTQAVVLNWDFSQNNRIERVDLPKTESGDIWYVYGPGTIRLKVRGGIEHDVPLGFAQVWRKGGRIVGVRIMLPPGTIDETYAAAMALARDWGVHNTGEIETFQKTRARMIERGGRGHYEAVSPDAPQPLGIEIRQSFQKHKPYYALLGLGMTVDFDEKRAE